MGGDRAPQAVVTGAVVAARVLPDVDIILTGDEAAVTPLLAAAAPIPANITLQHTPQWVEMCEPPGAAIRQKPNSSIAVGMRMVRDGKAQAIVSAGNSGAMMAGAMIILKAQPGIDRPAIATPLPTANGRQAILLDAGATTDCKPSNLVQFAQLGSTHASAVFQYPRPTVGLLSIGEEPSKGDELTKETHKLLAAGHLNFVGNVEPKEVLRGNVDVTVCDGFVGNLMLKASESVSDLVITVLKSALNSHWLYKLGAWLAKPAFQQVKKSLDYAEYGGALLLGVNGIVVIGHGRSNERAIENAIRVAVRSAQVYGTLTPATPRDTSDNPPDLS